MDNFDKDVETFLSSLNTPTEKDEPTGSYLSEIWSTYTPMQFNDDYSKLTVEERERLKETQCAQCIGKIDKSNIAVLGVMDEIARSDEELIDKLNYEILKSKKLPPEDLFSISKKILKSLSIDVVSQNGSISDKRVLLKKIFEVEQRFFSARSEVASLKFQFLLLNMMI